jgi:hypothetical protein
MFAKFCTGKNMDVWVFVCEQCTHCTRQAIPQELAQWLLTCVLLSTTRAAALEALLLDLLATREPLASADVLCIAALAFVADDDLGDDDRSALLELFRVHAARFPAFQTALQLLADDE